MNMTTAQIMRLTSLGLLPGIAALTWLYGPGILVNCVAGAGFAWAFDWLGYRLRGKPASPDCSAVVTGLLLGLALPPLLPVWFVGFGAGGAILLAKHAFGGLGANVFNPAMVGYCAMLVSFPLAMSAWPETGARIDLAALLAAKVGLGNGIPLAAAQGSIDALSGATPLDAFRNAEGKTFAELRSAGLDIESWRTVNGAFLVGGLFILTMGVTRATIPATFLLTLAMLAFVFDDAGSSLSLGPPTLHLMTGATMVTAFFIATDPVTSPSTRNGQIAFAIGCGVLVFVIRAYGGYPDGAAFAVLLMNAATPLIDKMVELRGEAA